MKKLIVTIAVASVIGIAVFVLYGRTDAWCDSIYHQNVGCPNHGNVEIPPEVLATQEAEHLVWCDSIYHQNVGCPNHGNVEIPPEVLATQEAEHLAWCDSIYHQNVGCPNHGNVEIPPEVLATQEAEHLVWCDSIDYRNAGCPSYGSEAGWITTKKLVIIAVSIVIGAMILVLYRRAKTGHDQSVEYPSYRDD